FGFRNLGFNLAAHENRQVYSERSQQQLAGRIIAEPDPAAAKQRHQFWPAIASGAGDDLFVSFDLRVEGSQLSALLLAGGKQGLQGRWRFSIDLRLLQRVSRLPINTHRVIKFGEGGSNKVARPD